MKYIKLFEDFKNDDSINDIYYHGTKTILPFNKFDKTLDGTRIVNSSGKKFGGFFFTSEEKNAEFYTEWFICKVKIFNIEKSHIEINNPPNLLKLASENNKIYLIEDILDGHTYSDIVVVPYSKVDNINIIEWVFVGDEDSYFENLDEFFGSSDNDEIIKDTISEMSDMMNLDLPYLLTIPIFKKYFDLKE